MYADTMPTVLCMSNGLIYDYIAGIHFFCLLTKEASCHASREICHNPSEFYNYYLVYHVSVKL